VRYILTLITLPTASYTFAITFPRTFTVLRLLPLLRYVWFCLRSCRWFTLHFHLLHLLHLTHAFTLRFVCVTLRLVPVYVERLLSRARCWRCLRFAFALLDRLFFFFAVVYVYSYVPHLRLLIYCYTRYLDWDFHLRFYVCSFTLRLRYALPLRPGCTFVFALRYVRFCVAVC